MIRLREGAVGLAFVAAGALMLVLGIAAVGGYGGGNPIAALADHARQVGAGVPAAVFGGLDWVLAVIVVCGALAANLLGGRAAYVLRIAVPVLAIISVGLMVFAVYAVRHDVSLAVNGTQQVQAVSRVAFSQSLQAAVPLIYLIVSGFFVAGFGGAIAAGRDRDLSETVGAPRQRAVSVERRLRSES